MHRMHRFEGRILPSLLGLLACLLSGCFATSGASPNAIPVVRVHAESDLDCPGDEIRITQRFGGQFEAVGCGHRAVYRTACDGLRCVVEDPGKSVPWRDRPEPGPEPAPR